MGNTKSEPWRTRDDTELRKYTEGVAASYCQSSEWEGVPLDKTRLEEKTFEHYKALRDGE
jgi:hypothetical protein